MQYESHDEYVEPRIETDFSAMDISEYILSLPEPARSICRAVVLEGRKVSQVARIFKVSRDRISRIMRNALRPLAEDFDIVPVRQKTAKVTDDGSDPTGAGRGAPPRGAREGGDGSFRAPNPESTTAEVVTNLHTLSFPGRGTRTRPPASPTRPPAPESRKKNAIHHRKKDDF